MRRKVVLFFMLLCAWLATSAQEFVNLTASEVRIDSVLPVYTQLFPLGPDYADSTYTVCIEYPEFADMTPAETQRYLSMVETVPGTLPIVSQHIGVNRRQGTLLASMIPIVLRDGRYQKLTGFRLRIQAEAAHHSRAQANSQPASRYAEHSVLATGQWAKISVPASGVYQITDALVRQAGFSNPAKVKVYGYGGALQPEVLSSNYLAETDDLHEVATCTVNGRRLFYAIGPVSWSSPTSAKRTRNPYSTAGCYFLTQSDDEPLTVDSASFVSSFYPANDDYHTLYEVDDFAWYHGGRNLFESTPIPTDTYRSYQMAAHGDKGTLNIVLSYDGAATVSVTVNDSLVGQIMNTAKPSSTAKAGVIERSFALDGLLKDNNTIMLRQTAGTATMRLDYMALTMPTAAPPPSLGKDAFPSPNFMYRITNQDHHADPQADMVIIIPTTQKLLSQAQRLQRLHEERDSLRINIVPADELFNEFSSGTPDASAYRRYLKMLYDRAESEADMPRYLLLMGDGAWDNRMLTSNWRLQSPDDFLLCYESENSWSETDCYVCDDFYCMLDDGEGASLAQNDMADVGVGRLTARTEAEAKILVDKVQAYMENNMPGRWQNTLCFMGDDGNNNIHMQEAEAAVDTATYANRAFNVKRVYWDAYQRSSTSTGFRYPDAERLIKQIMQQGALVMDYCGHGAAGQISHEKVLSLDDFAAATSLRLPLWVTASCDIMPFDTHEDNIGETAMLNSRGGAIAFFGTTRTVYTGDNRNMNCSFLANVLAIGDDGKPRTLGDAVRIAKNDVRTIGTVADPMGRTQSHSINKLHYTLLGDPAMRLALPTMNIVLDSINGTPVGNGQNITLAAGRQATVSGHIEGDSSFSGIASLTVKDVESEIVCRLNNRTSDGAETPFRFYDRPVTIYEGQDSIRQGHFTITFALPQDISYSEDCGQMLLHAVSNDRNTMANGMTTAFNMVSSDIINNDGTGPSIYCYLNTDNFQNGGTVNTTPWFFAQITDKDGINTAGSGIGHDLELTIDDDPSMTYILNQYFQYDFGNYCNGTVGYSLPQLEEGNHVLRFRAWDMLNNASVAELNFCVQRSLQPNCFSVVCTRNPATTQTTFVVNHDRTGSQMDVTLEIFDTSGRMLYVKSETGVPTDNTYQIDWNLTTDSGSRLPTGVYLYRVLISTDGSKKASKAEKLIIL